MIAEGANSQDKVWSQLNTRQNLFEEIDLLKLKKAFGHPNFAGLSQFAQIRAESVRIGEKLTGILLYLLALFNEIHAITSEIL